MIAILLADTLPRVMGTIGGLDGTELDQVVAKLAATPVLSLDSQKRRLREYWSEQTTVTSFVRHFGCLFCHEQVDDVIRALPDILSRGAQVVLIGNGSPHQAERFFREKGLPRQGVHVVTDPERQTYDAAGFKRGLIATFGHVQAGQAYLRARRQGHRITGWFGDLTQLGGTLVVHPPARGVFFHRSRFAGDQPRMPDVLAALG